LPINTGLRQFDFNYPVDKLADAIIKMGFASEEPIDVSGVQVAPKDLLLQLVPKPGNKFLTEIKNSILQDDLICG
jgi:hypothetical protein